MNKFDYNIVKNPEIFEQNRMAAHSDHVCYASEYESAAKCTSYRMSLDGLWKFSYAKNMLLAVEGFEAADYNCHPWDDIRVPAHIQMEGYDAPQYANVQYPWDGKEYIESGEIPAKFNPVASYVKYFTLPEHMKGHKICISFQGVESGFAVWLNGSYVGYSENSFDPAEFDLTPYIKDGENKLAVRVWKWTSSSWCEDQDFYRFSGIFRSVYIYMVPEVHVWDMSSVPVVAENLKEAELELTLHTTGKGFIGVTLSRGMDLVFSDEITCEDINCNSEDSSPESSGAQACKGCPDKKLCADGKKTAYHITNPVLWSAESPALYELRLEVKNAAGEVVEVITQNVGFRRFEMVDGIMTLNGKRIVFKGVNRHEFSSIQGRVPNEEELMKDIVTMKRNNINAIRTSHYPDDSKLYDLCDRYGLYMIAENNLESHGSWDAYLRGKAEESYIVPNDHENWKAMMLDRVNSCYQRDKNHPAILIWSIGNESYGGLVPLAMADKFHELDAHRLVHYEGLNNDRRYSATSDMESQMYPSVERIKEFLAEHPKKPFICCEYTHAMGNSCGGMHKYTDLTDTEPRYQGGFIWDYVDQSIYKKDRYGKWFQAYGGDFDERPSDYNFSGNGIVYGGKREESPKMQEVKFNYQNISVEFVGSTFTVINKNLFVNTDTLAAFVTLQQDGIEVRKMPMDIAVAPLSKESYEIPATIQSVIDEAEVAACAMKKEVPEYAVTVSFVLKQDELWAKAGHEVAFGQHVYKKEVKPYSCNANFEVIQGHYNLGVRGENFYVMFSTLTAGLTSYVFGGVEMIKAVPMPNFWRAPVDNDTGNMMQSRYAQWKIASMYVTAKSSDRFEDTSPQVEVHENSVKVTYKYYMPTTPASCCFVTYLVFGDGTIETTLTYDPVEGLGDMPEFGMMFKLDADYDRVRWYGLGAAETYADRKHGGKLGIYENKAADNMAQYLVPQECGNKCGVRWAKVMDLKGRGMEFFGDELSFSALPYTPHELENATHAYELPQVHYTVVRVAQQQMGVAGDDSWGAKIHPEYLLDVSKKKTFTFCFRGI